MSDEDRKDLAAHPENQARPYVRKFSECPTYGEAIKSAKTTSRTLLPKDVVPRMSIGTVETAGPDRVAPHAHPMLEQFFLGLDGNDIVVRADGGQTALGANELVHIPLGSSHGAEVAEGRSCTTCGWTSSATARACAGWRRTSRTSRRSSPESAPVTRSLAAGVRRSFSGRSSA